MKECLLCTKELKTGEHFIDLIIMNQQEEWICKECKEDFEQIGEGVIEAKVDTNKTESSTMIIGWVVVREP